MTELHQWTSTIVEVILLLIAIIGFAIKTNQDRQNVIDKIEDDVRRAKEMADKKLLDAKDDSDQKRARIYERLDAVKKYHDEKLETFRKIYEDRHEALKQEIADKYVPTQICKILHDTSSKEMEEIKKRIDSIFTQLQEINKKLGNNKSS